MNLFAPFSAGCLEGKVALVTGAGGGIGSAVARRFAGAGVRLAIADIRAEPLQLVAGTLPGESPLLWTSDLSVEAEVQQLFADILQRFGRIDIAVNAAGVLRATPLEEISKADWDQMMDANVGSAFLVCRECCAPMRAQGWGRIINFSSLAGQTGGLVAGAHYAAAKAAVISLTRSVAKYMAGDGVRCNAIAPSGVETDMLRQFTSEQSAGLLAGIPVGRFATPEDIAELVTWLASPAADFITGQTININGGAYLG